MKFYYNFEEKPMRIGPYTTSRIEIRHLIKSWILISLAFTIVRIGLKFNASFFTNLLISGITVGTAFLFHEIAHKIAAQHYGCYAEYRASNFMLFLGLISSFMGFIFFAPGAVFIGGPVGRRRNGIISASGPGTNFALAIIFLILMLYIKSEIWQSIFLSGYLINTWLGLFNMIPFLMFDGKKILNWNKPIYFLMLGLGIILLFSQEIISVLI